MRFTCLLALPVLASAFVTPSSNRKASCVRQYPPEQGGNDDGLVLGADVEAQMARLRNKFPTSEADYLAAARARSQQRIESNNDMANLEDFQRIAAEKRQQQQNAPIGDTDWENAEDEESSILMPYPEDVGEGGEGEEPRLML